jgi:hypothetical protein
MLQAHSVLLFITLIIFIIVFLLDSVFFCFLMLLVQKHFLMSMAKRLFFKSRRELMIQFYGGPLFVSNVLR